MKRGKGGGNRWFKNISKKCFVGKNGKNKLSFADGTWKVNQKLFN